MITKALITTLLFFFSISLKSQTGSETETDYLNMKKYVVGVGAVVADSVMKNNRKIVEKRFITIGSGLMTYSKYDTIIIYTVITARHVIDYFKLNKIRTLYIRPSWADTIKTTDYFGVGIPLENTDKTSNVYLYPESHIDLGAILMLPRYFDKLYFERDLKENTKIFPYNSMKNPFLGTQVWIGGYPGHIQSQVQNQFHYSFATFKPGYVAWKPPLSISNKELNHISLIESNASFGNSGGPVFLIGNTFELVGILVAGYDEYQNVYLGEKLLIDSLSKKPYLSKGRSGVSIIENAEYVKKLIEYTQIQIRNYKWKF